MVIAVKGLPPAKGSKVSPLSPRHAHRERARALLQSVARLPLERRQLFRGPIAFELRLRSPVRRSWDATNYLGGVADVLESKYRRKNIGHLGELADIAVYVNDRQIREVHARTSSRDRLAMRFESGRFLRQSPSYRRRATSGASRVFLRSTLQIPVAPSLRPLAKASETISHSCSGCFAAARSTRTN